MKARHAAQNLLAWYENVSTCELASNFTITVSVRCVFDEAPWALLRIDVEELRAVDDERVLALLTFTGIERGSTTEVTLKYAHLATFRGEEVSRVQAFSDWAEARAAAGLDG